MITLHTFGRAFGLADPSPFVVKAAVLLKMANLPFTEQPTIAKDLGKAPKGKLPYIEDAGTVVADSTFIRWHIEKKYGYDFDAGYGPADRATAWAFEKLCEDNLYWTVVHARWMIDRNFEVGPANFFKAVPALIRPLIVSMVRKKVRRNLFGQGMGRHAPEEMHRIAIAGVNAIADFLGDKTYLLGDRPCGVDATLYAFIDGLLCPLFETPIRTAAEKRANLVAYRDRMQAKYYPDGVK